MASTVKLWSRSRFISKLCPAAPSDTEATSKSGCVPSANRRNARRPVRWTADRIPEKTSRGWPLTPGMSGKSSSSPAAPVSALRTDPEKAFHGLKLFATLAPQFGIGLSDCSSAWLRCASRSSSSTSSSFLLRLVSAFTLYVWRVPNTYIGRTETGMTPKRRNSRPLRNSLMLLCSIGCHMTTTKKTAAKTRYMTVKSDM
mmetsp:Transcript_31244/g.96550  ORF Transcript_31244/g.96550 Transcript_31244/m.96550 type:complete len:200 (-) Transcript_31244:63-662(-)